MKFKPDVVLAAASDAVAIQSGLRPSHPHPLASEISLRDICMAAGLTARPQQPYETDLAVVARGMGTSDFSRALASGVHGVTVATYEKQAEHMQFCAVIRADDFLPADIPAVDSDLALEPLAEGAQVSYGAAFVQGGSAQVMLTTYARAVMVSRQLIINDSTSAIASIFANIGASAGRLEAKLVAQALEGNPNLDDGQAVFNVDFKNVVTDPLTMTTLGNAAGLLRTQLTTSGERADLRAKHLVVAAGMEFAARSLVLDIGLDLTVSTLAHLPEGRWYLMADQAVNPTVAVLRLRDAKSPVRVEQKRRPFECDGAAVKVTADLGATILRRVGIVRGGA